MEQGKEVIPIFFTVDDKYIPFLAVAIQSLIENSTEKFSPRKSHCKMYVKSLFPCGIIPYNKGQKPQGKPAEKGR